ncbi:MAG: tetratricopeptide repeat protein [Bdellovibrionaceae bacterium]|nr:tetratricopeptide repeat protein [Pseudobdellovibrionaceae bacterium]
MSFEQAPRAGNWAEESAVLEKHVVGGEHEICRAILSEIAPRSVPREWASRFAEMAWRVQFPLFTLKVLHRFVHPENPLAISPATDRENSLYASALLSLGAIREAAEILDPIAAKGDPDGLFFRANLYFYEWDYSSAIPLLHQFIGSDAISPYRRLVGKVNLAAAHVTLGDWESARALLTQIKEECERENYQLLLGNVHELLAQCDLFQGRYAQALPWLRRARELLKDQGGLYLLFVDKYIAIAETFLARDEMNDGMSDGKRTESNGNEKLARLLDFRARALGLGHWDSVRECDLFVALFKKDEGLLRHIVMGSPLEQYRTRVRRLSWTKIKAQGKYHWSLLGRTMAEAASTIEFDPYKKTATGQALYESPHLLLLFDALTQDFYKPANIGMLFQHVYQDEVFNPFSSPDRVLQLLKRLDRWWIENDLPIRVVFKKSEFALTSIAPVDLVLQRGKTLSAGDGKFADLKAHFGDRAFSTASVASVLGVSKATAQRVLAEGAAAGRLVKHGRGRSVEYRFASRGRSKEKAA